MNALDWFRGDTLAFPLSALGGGEGRSEVGATRSDRPPPSPGVLPDGEAHLTLSLSPRKRGRRGNALC